MGQDKKVEDITSKCSSTGDDPSGIKQTLSRLSEVSRTTTNRVADAVISALGKAQDFSEEMSVQMIEEMGQAINTATKLGVSVTDATRNAVVGVIANTNDAGVETIEAVQRTAHLTLESAKQQGRSLTETAEGVLDATVEFAQSVGEDAGRAMDAAMKGMDDAMKDVAPETRDQVHKLAERMMR